MTTQNQSITSATLLTRRKSPKAILCAIALIVVGTALYLVSDLLPDNSSSLYMACVVGGASYWLCHISGMEPYGCQVIGGITVFLTRILAVKYRICLPILSGQHDE